MKLSHSGNNDIDGPEPPNGTPQTKYVLPGQPTGWAAMADKMREYDQDKVQDVKEDIDTLLVFVRLSHVPYYCYRSYHRYKGGFVFRGIDRFCR
jgi:hypothetical protein